jgi:hypothetical protein
MREPCAKITNPHFSGSSLEDCAILSDKGMLLLLLLHLLLILLAAAVAKGWIPMKLVSGLVEGFHATIGISAPTEKQLRWVIIAWIASLLLIFDTMVAMFLYVF